MKVALNTITITHNEYKENAMFIKAFVTSLIFYYSQAGINNDQPCIALEPEAASMHCQYLPTEKLKGASKGFTMTWRDKNYMVVDLGCTIYLQMIYI